MVEQEVIMERISIIKNSLKRLRELSRLSEKEFKGDRDNFAVAEHHLHRSLEAVLDIGRHICSSENYGRPEDYSEIFEILGQHNVLDEEFASSIKGMAGYRKRLVHMYNMVSQEEMLEILHTRLDDFDIFIKEIMEFI